MQDDINLEELTKNSKPSFLKIFFIVLGTIIGVFAIAFGVVSLLKLLSNTAEKVENKKPEIAKVTEKRAPHRIGLQYLIDDWRRSQGITEESSVLIYDLNNSDIVGRFNDTKTFPDPPTKIIAASVTEAFTSTTKLISKIKPHSLVKIV